MGKVTITLLLTSTGLLLVAFTKGIGLLQGGHDVLGHLYWAMAALIGGLTANVFAIFHAAQSDRLIRDLRAATAQIRSSPESPDDAHDHKM